MTAISANLSAVSHTFIGKSTPAQQSLGRCVVHVSGSLDSGDTSIMQLSHQIAHGHLRDAASSKLWPQRDPAVDSHGALVWPVPHLVRANRTGDHPFTARIKLDSPPLQAFWPMGGLTPLVEPGFHQRRWLIRVQHTQADDWCGHDATVSGIPASGDQCMANMHSSNTLPCPP